MIKTIILDLGNVLIFVRNVHAGLDFSDCGYFKKHAIRSKVKLYEKGKISTEEFYTWFGKKTKKDIDVKNLDALFEKVFSLNEDMASLLKRLKNDCRLVVLSNTNEANYNFVLKRYDILNIFDDYVLSYKVGSLKPEEKIYKIALEKSLCNPEECIFIDDKKEFVDAAKRFGIKAIQYKSHSFLEEKLKEFGVLKE